MRRRGLVVLGVVAALAVLRAGDREQPLAVVGHAGVSVPTSTTTAPPPPPTTTTTTAPKTVVVANRSSTVVRSDTGGVTVVNEGSAVASTGGNTVIGPTDASVANGPVSAVGNSADVRINRP